MVEVSVGDTDFKNEPISEEKGESKAWEPDNSGIVAWGNVKFVTQTSNYEANKTVVVNGITITYDAARGNRNLKWSTNTIDAVLDQTFDAPKLSGNYIGDVTYGSSNTDVAYINSEGEITLVGIGSTTITAYGSESDAWNSDSASYDLIVSPPEDYNETTINIETPGTLQDKLLDLSSAPSSLIVHGTLNSEDITYINAGKGRIAKVRNLNLKDVEFFFDGGSYASCELGSTGLGMGKYKSVYYLSNENYVDTTSVSTGLGGSNITYHYYSNCLAGAFANNRSLKHVVLPDCLTTMGCDMFRKSAVESVELSQTITAISDGSFCDTDNLIFLNLQNITEIGNDAFLRSNIESIFSREKIIKIGEGAFRNSKIANIDLSSAIEMGQCAFFSSNLSGEINLSSLKYIPPYAFTYVNTISGVRFCEDLESIGDWAFEGCDGISHFELHDGLKYIGMRALSVDGVNVSINAIPATVTYIGANALPYEWVCGQPTEDDIWYFGQVAYMVNASNFNSSVISIKDGVVSISPGFLADNNKVKSVIKSLTLPQSLTVLGEVRKSSTNSVTGGVFSDCTELSELNFSNSFEVFGDGVFKNCPKLKINQWPETLKEIGSQAFYGCVSIDKVVLPLDFKYISWDAFGESNGLSVIEINSRNLICPSLSNPFGGASSSVEKVVFGPMVETIPAYLFYHCSSLKIVDFSDMPEPFVKKVNSQHSSTIKIEDNAFNGCSSLKTLILPAYTSTIGVDAFEGNNLSTIYNYMYNPIDVSNTGLLNKGIGITVYVPENSLQQYTSDINWSKTNLIGMVVNDAGINDLRSELDDNTIVECYNLQGIRIYVGPYSQLPCYDSVILIKVENKIYKHLN